MDNRQYQAMMKKIGLLPENHHEAIICREKFDRVLDSQTKVNKERSEKDDRNKCSSKKRMGSYFKLF